MKNQFLELIQEVFEMEDKNITMKDEFRDYDTWDSLTQLSLIAEIDEVFDVVIEEKTFTNLITLEALFGEIEKRTKA